MKKLLKVIAILCSLTLLFGCGSNDTANEDKNKKDTKKYVVTINGKGITEGRFNYYFYNEQDEILQSANITSTADIPSDFWEQKTDGKTNLSIAKENALAAAIDDVLKYQKAVDEKIKLTKEENQMIESQLAQMKQDTQTMAQLEQIGVDTASYEELIEESMYIQKLAMKYANDGTIAIDNTQVENEFRSNYVKAQHILFMTVDEKTNAQLSDDKIAEKKALADKVLAEINAGGDFEELMNKYCEDPGIASAPDGYVFTTGQMVQEFEEAAFNLAEGQVSPIVETSYGYHIIKRVPFDMKGQQETQYMEQFKFNYAYPELDTFTKEWKAEADIEINEKLLDKIKPTIVG